MRSDFHLHRGNLQAVKTLVTALDGMPLALELAAARVRSIALAQMLVRLTEPVPGQNSPVLDLLSRASPRAGHDPRNASMQAVIAWSWQQLSPPQACLLAGLTVFAGGCTGQAADAVCGQAGHDTALLLDVRPGGQAWGSQAWGSQAWGSGLAFCVPLIAKGKT